MLFICPNTACGKQYDIDPAQIPAGKTGFKCKDCGTLVPVSAPATAAPAAGAEDADMVYRAKITQRKSGISAAMVGMVVGAIALIGSTVAYFYIQYQSIAGQSVAITTNTISDERKKELMEGIRKESNR